MPDLSLEDELKFRRKAMATRTTLISEFDINDQDELKSVTKDEIPPPPPMPTEQTFKSSASRKPTQKFDLRPQEMKIGKDEYGRPPITAIGEGINAPATPGINSESINNIRRNLRKVDVNGKGNSKISPVGNNKDKEIEIDTEFAFTRYAKDRDRHNVTKLTRMLDEVIDKHGGWNNSTSQKDNDETLMHKHSPKGVDPSLSQKTITRKVSNNPKVDAVLFAKALKLAREEVASEYGEIDKIENWQERVESETDMKSLKKMSSFTSTTRQSETSNDASKFDDDTRSVTTNENGTRRKSSLAKRRHKSPSICFGFPEGNDNVSEISDDDVINTNREHPEHGSYDYVCSELQIREPFNQPELNVLHAICEEYFEIARLTFAKRRLFIRSLPHNERVYNFLSSRKRSGWLEKGDVARGAMSSKTLDYLFSVTLRRKSRRIEGHTLNLDGFNEGRVLEIRRFTRIIRDAFTRRSHLFDCAVGKLHDYSKIN